MIPQAALSDIEVIDLVLAGRVEQFRTLVERYEKKVAAMGFGFFHNGEEARDFTQEVFLKAYHALSGFEGRSGFSTWLYRIAYNQAVNTLRSRGGGDMTNGGGGEKDGGSWAYRSLAGEDFVENAPSAADEAPERAAIKTAIRDAVRQAVRELPERYRVCIDFSFFYDLTYEEIARITGFPVNTVKSHILRAKKILREKLQESI